MLIKYFFFLTIQLQIKFSDNTELIQDYVLLINIIDTNYLLNFTLRHLYFSQKHHSQLIIKTETILIVFMIEFYHKTFFSTEI